MKIATGLIWTGCLAAMPGAAYADSSMSIQLVAHVDVFCHIYPPVNDVIDVKNGFATIGQVREVCNTPSGYDVSTSFSNVTVGNLNVDGKAYTLTNGSAMRSSDEPAVRTMAWTLSNAQLNEQSAPVVMQVTISPR
ncbi:MAG: hypothetical protein M3R41_06060 [Pseudomonadota bacterium]|nr:hypothetical protein [Pseudomonadota bacterium]